MPPEPHVWRRSAAAAAVGVGASSVYRSAGVEHHQSGVFEVVTSVVVVTESVEAMHAAVVGTRAAAGGVVPMAAVGQTAVVVVDADAAAAVVECSVAVAVAAAVAPAPAVAVVAAHVERGRQASKASVRDPTSLQQDNNKIMDTDTVAPNDVLAAVAVAAGGTENIVAAADYAPV